MLVIEYSSETSGDQDRGSMTVGLRKHTQGLSAQMVLPQNLMRTQYMEGLSGASWSGVLA